MPSNTMPKPVRLALVGAGIFARDAHLPALLRQRDQFELVAVYSRTAANAEALAQAVPTPPHIYTDLTALWADPTIEAVDIVLPIGVMPAVVAQALTSGKHVISEKPIAPDVATAQQLIDIHARQPGQVWMVAENWRYETAFVQAAALVQRGEIGRPVTCHLAVYAPVTPASKYYHSAWRRAGAFAGGPLLDGGVHHIAALRLIVGDIAAVGAMTAQVAPDAAQADTLSATLHFANGAVGTYLVSYAVGAGWPSYLHVVGESGALRVQRGEIEITRNGSVETINCAKFDGVDHELTAFAAAIQAGAPHHNTPAAALRDVAVIEALLRSAVQGQTVTITTG